MRLEVAGGIVVKLFERDGGLGALRAEKRHHNSQAFGCGPVVPGAVADRVQAPAREDHLASRNDGRVARQFVMKLDTVVGGYVDGSGSERHKHASAQRVVRRRRRDDGLARAGIYEAPVAADSDKQVCTIRLTQHCADAPRQVRQARTELWTGRVDGQRGEVKGQIVTLLDVVRAAQTCGRALRPAAGLVILDDTSCNGIPSSGIECKKALPSSELVAPVPSLPQLRLVPPPDWSHRTGRPSATGWSNCEVSQSHTVCSVWWARGSRSSWARSRERHCWASRWERRWCTEPAETNARRPTPSAALGSSSLGSGSCTSSIPSLRRSTLAAGRPKRPESVASLVRIDGVSARPVAQHMQPKMSAPDSGTAPGRNKPCVWHCTATGMGNSSDSPNAAAALARRRALAWAATRANCITPDATKANRCAGQ
eukprot:scaffold56402_cov64-Phaeocystis_antarctica.AAC.2